MGLPMLLIMKQPDLGTALILYLIATTILMVVSLQLHVKLFTLGAELLVGTAFFLFKLHGYQKKRLLTFIDPSLDPSGAGWHARQAHLRRRQRQVDRQGLAARHAKPAAVPARALDRLPVRGVRRGVGLRRLRDL